MSTLRPGRKKAQQTPSEKPQIVVKPSYEIFVVALTILQIVNSFLWVFVSYPQSKVVVAGIFLGVAVFLLADAVYRLVRAFRYHVRHMKYHGWLVVIGSLPIPFFAILRLIWIGLMTRTLKRTDLEEMGELVVEKRAQSTLLVTILAAVIVLEVASIMILGAESQSSQANIHNASDAVWWSIVTMATVGYGDKYPVTNPGRVIGIFVMIVGVGLFSVMTSFLAQWFLRNRQGDPASTPQAGDNPKVLAKLDALSAALERLEASQQSDTTDLRARLAAIESALDRDGR
jgi:voltage-gated potassium channel